jgi:hypothetical protein
MEDGTTGDGHKLLVDAFLQNSSCCTSSGGLVAGNRLKDLIHPSFI